MNRAASPIALTATLCLAGVLGMMGFATFPALLPGFIGEWGLSNTVVGLSRGMVVFDGPSGQLTDEILQQIYYRDAEADDDDGV